MQKNYLTLNNYSQIGLEKMNFFNDINNKKSMLESLVKESTEKLVTEQLFNSELLNSINKRSNLLPNIPLNRFEKQAQIKSKLLNLSNDNFKL
jgi:hypothetical protein